MCYIDDDFFVLICENMIYFLLKLNGFKIIENVFIGIVYVIFILKNEDRVLFVFYID